MLSGRRTRNSPIVPGLREIRGFFATKGSVV
jgi:hypothetical protein